MVPVSAIASDLDNGASFSTLRFVVDAYEVFRDKSGDIVLDPTSASTHSTPNDPIFPWQWHLFNTGQSGGVSGVDLNLRNVWDEFDGSGVTVGIWDDGVQYTHPDLNDNYSTALHVFINGVLHDPAPQSPDSEHGTAVAGIIAAEADNNTGVVGVAHGATLGAVDFFFDPLVTVDQTTTEIETFDATNHSWGFDTPFAANFESGSSFWVDFFSGVVESTAEGRDGLGTVNIKSAGNSRQAGRDANDTGFNAMPQTITVAAVTHDGVIAFYSTPGANLLISGPSNGDTGSGIWTTDRTGSEGYSNGFNEAGNSNADYTNSFGGTSAAGPNVAGVVALMLDANPDLGWRDVQTILANTATHTGSAIGAGPSGFEIYSWAFNDADHWNGGGMHFSNDYGFGLVDAHAAVRLAETWTQQSTNDNWFAQAVASVNVNQVVPDNNASGISFNITTTADVEVEQVGLNLQITNGFFGDYRVTLTSPSGTVTTLSVPLNDGTSQTGTWTYIANNFRGEDTAGTWTVTVADQWAGFTGTVGTARLEFYGAEKSADDLYIFTEEYSDYAGSATHGTAFNDGNGGTDTVNAAAVLSGTQFNLTAGTGTIDGENVTLSGIENVVTGDGNDTVRGNGANNFIFTGRGADELRGEGGNDTLEGGDGGDDLLGGGDKDTASYETSNEAVQVALFNGSATGGHAQGDTFNSIENLIGSAFDDTLSGDTGQNVLTGGPGGDALFGGGDFDFASYMTSSAGVSVGLFNNSASGGDATGDSLVSIENLVGSNFNDVLSGDGGRNVFLGLAGNDEMFGGGGDDELRGGNGNDWMLGAAGADVLDGGTGFDTASYSSSPSAVTVSLFNFMASGGHATGDSLVSIENIEGSDFDDVLSGNRAPNFFTGGAGADQIFGGVRADWADYLGSNAGVTISLFNNTASGGHATGDSLVSIENLRGSNFADVLSGDSGLNTLVGASGSDELFGGAGDDDLSGGKGADLLVGGRDNDTLTGGADSDVFRYGDGDGADIITDFQDGFDLIDLVGGLSFGDFTETAISGGTRLTLIGDPSSSIDVLGVTPSELSGADFI